MRPWRSNFKSKTLGAALLLPLALSPWGCVVRTQEFHCVEQPTQNTDKAPREQDLEMSPTEMRFAGRSFRFREEVGVERLYQAESGQTLRFNVASNQLVLEGSRWLCRRYLAP